MKRKIITIFLLLCFALSLAGCVGSQENSNGAKVSDPTPKPVSSYETSKPIIPYDEILQVTWLRVADEKLSTAALEFLLLNFGLKVTEKNFKSQNMTVNIEKLYQSTLIPDLSTGLSLDTVARLSELGCFEDLSQQKLALMNYFSLWNGLETAWEYTKADIMQDEKLFCLVPVNRRASKAWIYNKTYFESHNMEFPKTVEDLYNLLSGYKKANPLSAAMWFNKYEPLQMEGLLNAYGLTADEWQTNENGEVFYLYGDKRWYEALEWLNKFEKAGFVPTDKNGVLKELSDADYEKATSASQQIIEFSDGYNYLFVQGKQQGYDKWAIAENMIVADENTTPAMKANKPYLNEATCISTYASDKLKNRIMALLDWLCTDEGNMWANFGREGVGYKKDADGNMVFLKYYSDEMTPQINKEEKGTVSSLTIGRLFTTVPWDKVKVVGKTDRYSSEEQFLKSAKLRLVYPERFLRGEEVIENATELHYYDVIMKKMRSLTAEFEALTRRFGFSEEQWEDYYDSLVEAGMMEYTAYMQSRKY